VTINSPEPVVIFQRENQEELFLPLEIKTRKKMFEILLIQSKRFFLKKKS